MKNKKTLYEKYFKRLFDIIISFFALIILCPFIFLIAILIKLKLGSPIIFCQKRPGKSERIFKMYKFRSMTDKRDKNNELLPDEIRLTKFGKILRKTSLDELPELWNILKGDMSLVGPRPLLVEYLDLYNEEQRNRHSVRPGLTGLAQINGRNAIDWNSKFKYDIEYIECITFMGDMKILLNTVRKVLIKEGISSNTSETMEKFTGKN